jgi:hypothetical protein
MNLQQTIQEISESKRQANIVPYAATALEIAMQHTPVNNLYDELREPMSAGVICKLETAHDMYFHLSEQSPYPPTSGKQAYAES